MRVLFNDLILLRRRSGVGGYAASLLQGLTVADARVSLLSDTWAGLPLKAFFRLYGAARREARPSARSRSPGLAGSVRDLAEAAAFSPLACWLTPKAGCDLYHEPDAIPLPIDLPTVTTFHDLSVLRYPQWHPAHRVRKYERHLKRGLAHTRRFIAVSHATRDEMVSWLGISAEKIHVVPEAPRPGFRRVPVQIRRSVQARHGLEGAYFLFVGTLEPRKNVNGLLDAYALLPRALRDRCPLVLAGGWGWGSDQLRSRIESETGSVRWLGYLPDDELVALLGGATALVYPSFYEGFGLPPLEAMACGTPVITSNVGAIQETVGQAALTVSPESPEALASAMRSLVEAPELGDEYRRRGEDHLKGFSWRAAAEQTLKVYRAALG